MVWLHTLVASSNKLSPKFTGPYKIVEKPGGKKYKIQNLKTLEVTIRHADDLKKFNMEVDVDLAASQPESENEETDRQAESDSEDNDAIDDTDEIHDYRKKLRSHTHRHM